MKIYFEMKLFHENLFEILRVNKLIFFQPSFILLHSHYEWNNNTYLPLIDNCISFIIWVFFSFFIWNMMNFFQFNSIQFAVWYWGISLLCLMNFQRDNHFFLIHSNETSHDKHLFSFHDYQHTSNQSLFPTTITVLSTFLI